jgi:hypothetical protein
LFRVFLVASVVKLVDTADLKSAAFLHKGRTGSIPVRGTIICFWLRLLARRTGPPEGGYDETRFARWVRFPREFVIGEFVLAVK